MLKSALSEEPISTRPSLPIPVCGALHALASSSGWLIGYWAVST
jgi:hypothetical protein